MARATRTSGTRVRVSRLTRRRLITGALGASGLLLLAGCAPPAPASAPVASAPPKAEAPTAAPVVAAAPTTAAPAAAPKTAAPAGKAVETAQVAAAISVNYVPLFVGIEKGIFLKHGLDLQLKLLATTPEATKALGAGEAQFAVSPFSVTPAYEQGVTFVNVATVQGDAAAARVDTPFSIFAHKDAGIGSGEIAKLKGKKMGLVAGTTPEQYLLAVLGRHGLKADDFTAVNVPLASQRSAMAGKQVDAIVTIEPYGALLSKLPETVEVVRGGGYINYSILLAPSTKFFAEQPGLVERAVYGLAEAAQLARQNRASRRTSSPVGKKASS